MSLAVSPDHPNDRKFQHHGQVVCPPVHIAASKIFTYPTQLISTGVPSVLEIHVPEEQKTSQHIEVISRQDSTLNLGVESAPSIVLKMKGLVRKTYGKTTASMHIDKGYIYDARYENDGNIAHILYRIALEVLAVKQVVPEVTVILRKNATAMAKTIYQLLGIPVICTDKRVDGNLLVLPSDQRNDREYIGLLNHLFGKLSFAGYNPHTPKRVFLARKNTRYVSNEAEVEQLLQTYGFTKVYFEDGLSLSEQWSIARNAEVIVGVHGAALSSLIFNCKGVKLIELFHPGYVVNMYRLTANAIGGQWCGVTGQMPPNLMDEIEVKCNTRQFALAPMKIDPGALQRALADLNVSQQSSLAMAVG